MAKAKKSVKKVTTITETVNESHKKPKKSSKKKTTKKTPKKRAKVKTASSPKVSSPKHPADERMEKVLIENFVTLQKVLTNMAVKFDNLSDQMSKLLNLFEMSAKSLAEKDFESDNKNKENDKELVKKLDTVLEQNKIIARGVTMIHEEDENDRRIEQGLPPVPGTKVPPYKNIDSLRAISQNQNPPVNNQNRISQQNQGMRMPINPFGKTQEQNQINSENNYQKSIASQDKAEE